MTLVRVKKKYQVVIPEDIRAVVGVEVGDTFDVSVLRGKITFTPKSVVVVDRKPINRVKHSRTAAKTTPRRPASR